MLPTEKKGKEAGGGGGGRVEEEVTGLVGLMRAALQDEKPTSGQGTKSDERTLTFNVGCGCCMVFLHLLFSIFRSLFS